MGSVATRPSLAIAVYNELKQAIVTCTYVPGDSLHEAELAARFRVSKTPVREALNLLRRDGLIESFPRHGYRVAGVTVKDVYDVYQLRLLLEPPAAALAARSIDAGSLEELKALARIDYVHGDRGSYTRFLEANRRFHAVVARASGNERLAAVVERLLEEMHRFFHLGIDAADVGGEMAQEHKELVHAIGTGDADAAQSISHRQIEASRQRVIDAMATRPVSNAVTFSPGVVHVRYNPDGGEWTIQTTALEGAEGITGAEPGLAPSPSAGGASG